MDGGQFFLLNSKTSKFILLKFADLCFFILPLTTPEHLPDRMSEHMLDRM